MPTLYRQRDILIKLKKNNIANFTNPSFVGAVNKGQIPIAETKSNVKFYYYKDVKKAILKAGIGGIHTNRGKVFKQLDTIPPPTSTTTADNYGEDVVAKLKSNPTITDVNIYKAIYSGKLEQLKYEKEQNLLIKKDVVEEKAYSVARIIRDKINTIPERLSNELATMTDPHAVKELLFSEFSKLLSDFSEKELYE